MVSPDPLWQRVPCTMAPKGPKSVDACILSRRSRSGLARGRLLPKDSGGLYPVQEDTFFALPDTVVTLESVAGAQLRHLWGYGNA